MTGVLPRDRRTERGRRPPVAVIARPAALRSCSGAATAVLLLAASGCATQDRVSVHPAADGTLPATTAQWVQEMLDGWTLVTRAFLGEDPLPLPWIVLFDSSAVWHIAPRGELPHDATPVDVALTVDGDAVPIHHIPHQGVIALPNGSEIPAESIAAAMTYRDGVDAFFVLALPEVWRRQPQAATDDGLDLRILSVAIHEIIHTRQLPDLHQRIRALQARHELPARLHDDVIERRFRDVRDYREMFEAERDLLYQAVFESDEARRRGLITEALSIAQNRRVRFFVGVEEVCADLEALFLNMEGVAEWLRFKFHRSDPRPPTESAEVMTFLRGRDNSWSQDEGLALILLLDELAIDWRERIVGPEMASPFELLAQAVGVSWR